WFEGMAEGNVHELGWALEGESTLRPELEREGAELIASLESESDTPMGEDYSLSSADVQVLRPGAIRAMLAASMREGIGRTIDGYVDDDLAFVRPWGFDVASITRP